MRWTRKRERGAHRQLQSDAQVERHVRHEEAEQALPDPKTRCERVRCVKDAGAHGVVIRWSGGRRGLGKLHIIGCQYGSSQNLSIFSADFSRLQLGLLSATICTHAHGAPVLLAAATAELYRESLAIILGDV